jgi:hypothetical protein
VLNQVVLVALSAAGDIDLEHPTSCAIFVADSELGGTVARRARQKSKRDRLTPAMKAAYRGIRGSMAGLMRAQLEQERQRRGARITTLKAMIKRIKTALAKPGSKTAVRNLRAIKDQLARDLRLEVTKLADRTRSGTRMLVKLRRDARDFWGSRRDG